MLKNSLLRHSLNCLWHGSGMIQFTWVQSMKVVRFFSRSYYFFYTDTFYSGNSIDSTTLSSQITWTYIAILETSINELVQITLSNNGCLSSSLPVSIRTGQNRPVQICHGTPGLLLLLTILISKPSSLGSRIQGNLPIEDIYNQLSQVVWSQGLITKGLRLCHGVTGNAYPWLLMSSLPLVEV